MYTPVIVNGVEAKFSSRVIDMIPCFQGRETSDNSRLIVSDLPCKVETRYLYGMHKMLAGYKLVPMVDLTSHKCVYELICMMNALDFDMDTIAHLLEGWTQCVKWVELWDPCYIYPIVMLGCESAVDVRKYMREHPDPFAMVPELAKLPLMKQHSTMYIDMLLFFKNYNINLCFSENNDTVQEKIDTITQSRNTIWRTFLICPHQEFLADYFEYTPSSADVWSAYTPTVITPLAAYTPGDRTIAPENVVHDRVVSFTLGLLQSAPNKHVKTPFPFANVALAGGAVTKMLSANFDSKKCRQSDVDIFIFGADFTERSRTFEEVINWFKTYDPDTKTATTYYALQGSVTTIYVRDCDRKFQVISMNATNAYDVISRFDFTHIQWCLHDGTFYGTPDAFIAAREQMTRFRNIKNLRVERLIKALYCGYDIMKDADIVENHVDISILFTPEGADRLQKYIRALFKWWYPRADPDVDPADEMNHILSMIEEDAHATNVTVDPLVVFNNITIDGNFDGGDYASNSFTKFNMGNIVNGMGRRVVRATVRSKQGAIRLTTSPYTVVSARTGATGMDISLRIDDAFVEFCRLLEGQVFRLFRNGGVTSHVFDDNNIVKFSIANHRIENQVKFGVSIMRSQRGEPLNISEDLYPGDSVQILFIIEIVAERDDRKVELKPIKIVKFVKYDTMTAPSPTPACANECVARECDEMVLAETTIQYDD